jgi:YfiH family protein
VERRSLDDDLHALVATELERRGFLASFSERAGGTSQGPYRSLNLGIRTDDDPNRVRRNRDILRRGLGVPELRSARQVHGDTVARVGPADDPETPVAEADILEVTEQGVPVAVLVADCLPIALASEAEGRLVAIHAGWRGLARGILGRAASLFASPDEVTAVVGPAIGPCHYQIGPEVAEAVSRGSPAAIERRDGRLVLDLPGTAIAALRASGIRGVEVAGLCTACHEERFYSYRRDGPTGRQALVAMRL